MAATIGGYELIERVAVGGMAEIFLARPPGRSEPDQLVAVKRILPHLAQEPDFVAMFLDEARLTARLDHPHIVQVHDCGVADDNHYLAMEFICGEDLQTLMRRAYALGVALDAIDVATILLAACAALDHAHERGILHRDVTPDNLIISYDGIVKLTDFGIAKSNAVTARPGTSVGTLKGKVPYMSPEQARALPLDRRSDLFSLGVIGWELITGRRRFEPLGDLDLLQAVQHCELRPIAAERDGVPRPLAAAIEIALSADPLRRWATAAEFGEALSAWLRSEGEEPGRGRLVALMARLFGPDAAEQRLAAVSASLEAPITHVATLNDVTLAPTQRSLGQRIAPVLLLVGLVGLALLLWHRGTTIVAAPEAPAASPSPATDSATLATKGIVPLLQPSHGHPAVRRRR